MEDFSRKNRRSNNKRDPITIHDNEPINGNPAEKAAKEEAESVTSLEVAELQEKLRKSEGQVQKLIRKAAHEKEKKEYLENLIDKKDDMDSVKKVVELEKRVTDLEEEAARKDEEIENARRREGMAELRAGDAKRYADSKNSVVLIQARKEMDLEKKVSDLTNELNATKKELEEERIRSSEMKQQLEERERIDNGEAVPPSNSSHSINGQSMEFLFHSNAELLKKNAELEQNLSKMDKQYKGACRIAGEEKARVEHLEKIVDQKDAVLNGGKKMEELEKSVTDLTKEVESRGERINELPNKLKESEEQIKLLANQHEMDDRGIDSQGSGGGEGKRRSSRNTTKPVKNIDLMEDSDEDGGPPVKKTKSESGKKDMKQSRLKKDRSESVIEKKTKKNDTELECFECEYRTYSVTAWTKHLGYTHSTTPALAGLALRCDCGHESVSYKHSLKCNIANFTVIRKRDGPIRRLNDAKDTPKCILCESYPSTARGYCNHLQTHHKTTLSKNGIYLKCECSVEVLNHHTLLNHNKKCDGRQFALHYLNEN